MLCTMILYKKYIYKILILFNIKTLVVVVVLVGCTHQDQASSANKNKKQYTAFRATCNQPTTNANMIL